MAYLKQDFTDGKVLMASHLNHIEDGISNIWDVIYPVGSVYMSMNATSPAQLFGGTWQQRTDRFLVAAGNDYEAGATGGSSTVTLTVDQMPSHSHNAYLKGRAFAGSDGGTFYGGTGADTNKYNVVPMDAIGGGQAHENKPPYLAVYMWIRTA